MVHRVLKVGRWVVDFLFAVERYDEEGTVACLRDAGAPGWVVERARGLMGRCSRDCGFTFSNPENRRAVVLIGPTSSGSEFLDTLVHEIHHLAVAIAAELGMDLESETPAYLAGDSARSLAEVVCELGCGRCRG